MSTKRNIPKTLIGFLIASLLFWLLINLSKEYTSVVSFNVNYGQLPQNKLLKEKPLDKIDLLIKGAGFNLFSAKISSQKITLEIDRIRQKSGTNFYLLPNEQRLIIQQQLSSGLKLEEVLQDTIRLKIGTLASKKIPVINNAIIQFQPGYNLSEEIKITPDSIIISGAEEQLKSIKKINLANTKLDAVNSDFEKTMPLENLNNVKLSNTNVLLSGKVDKFTEGTLEMPYKVINVPVDVDLKTFPKTVKITYNVGLKNFNKINKDLFEIVCDYKQMQENDLNYLIPKVRQKPSLVSSIKIKPNTIEFFIHK